MCCYCERHTMYVCVREHLTANSNNEQWANINSNNGAGGGGDGGGKYVRVRGSCARHTSHEIACFIHVEQIGFDGTLK